MKMNKITKTPTVNDFISALNRGEEAIREAATILCQMVDHDPKTYEKIHKETGIHWNVLGNLERVGRGAMHYAMLPASQQAECYDKGIQVVNITGGKTIVESKKPQELTMQEARVVFDVKHVRTIEEQVKVVKQPKPATPAKAAQRYSIADDKLTVFAATVFTMSQLQDILEQMKSKAIKSLATKK